MTVSQHRRIFDRTILVATLLFSLCAGTLTAQSPSSGKVSKPTKKIYNPPYANNPVTPFKIVGNIYYIGMTNFTSYLIKTNDGLIMLDQEDKEQVANLKENIQKLGFNLKDVKILLQAHAHIDHVGGTAAMKEATGGKVYVMAQDESVLADGGKTDFRNFEGHELWKPVKADKVINDGEKVTQGGVTMTAHLTAGHSKGCTTWSTVAEEGGKKYNVVFVCSNRLNDGVPLVNNPKFPNIAEAYANGFTTLRSLPCDVFLASHAFMFDLEGKMKRMNAGGPNPFVDPKGYKEYIEDYEHEFLYQLQEAKAGGPPPGTPAKK